MPRSFDVEHFKSLGRQLRRLRETRRWSVRRLSEKSGLSVTAIRRIEAGQADPRLSSVLRLAEALGKSIDRLIDDVKEVRPAVRVTRASRGQDAGGEILERDLTGDLHDPRVAATLVSVRPGERRSVGEREGAGAMFCYLLDGRIRVAFRDGEVASLSTGDALHVVDPPPVEWRNESARVARLLVLEDSRRRGSNGSGQDRPRR